MTQHEPSHEGARRRAVAIVGRPNVGKSAIFNRIVGKRLAIVHAESGVTRDRHVAEARWEEQTFELIDTGGVTIVDRDRTRDVIEHGVRLQVEMALSDAAVALLVVDINNGIHPLDEEVALLLRTTGCTVITVANKADNAGRDDAAADFERLGYPVYAVSALQDRGFDVLLPTVVGELPPAGENTTIAEPLKVAVVGRPNVGKSSFINRLLQSDRLLVSDIPGTTRDSIDVPFTVGHSEGSRHYVLIDTAGLRKKSRVDSVVEQYSQMRTERSIKRADLVVLVIDAELGASLQDKKIAAMVYEYGKACVVLVNKCDLTPEKMPEKIAALKREMPFMVHCPVVFVSAKTGLNIRTAIDAVDRVAANALRQLPTGMLNRALIGAYEKTQPPMVGGKRLKMFYSTQINSKPLIIRIFVNDTQRVVDAYKAYLTRVLRSNFELDGLPVILQFRARPRGEE